MYYYSITNIELEWNPCISEFAIARVNDVPGTKNDSEC